METTSRPPAKKSRKPLIIGLSITISLLFLLMLTQVSFKLPDFLNPNTPTQTLSLVSLSALIFLLLITLSFVLVRNLLKLYAERQTGMPGSKFRTRMVTGALALSFTPVIFLFLFAYGLMNRSIDRWFSRPVEELREDSERVANLLSRYAQENARSEALAIAQLPETQRAYQTSKYSTLMDEFRRREQTLEGGFALALADDYPVVGYNAPAAWGELRGKLPLSKNNTAPSFAHSFSMDGHDYMLGSATVSAGTRGMILVAIPLPAEFRQALNHIEASDRKYQALSDQRKQVRRFYMGLLLLLTVIVLFIATWFALFLSKFVTRPVSALVEATQEISRGNLDYRVEVPAADELGALVASFNRMAEELESSRREIEASSRQLSFANVELEQRRRHMEAILESIPTGVLSLSATHHVVRANSALSRIFSPGAKPAGAMRNFPAGARLRDLFPSEVIEDLESIMRKADRMGTFTSQMEVPVQRAQLNVAITVSSLQHEGRRQGYVLVFEDLSDLLKANKQAAWREVARRVAHEIKNPLTPIALSAERILRHLDRSDSGTPGEESVRVIRSCAETIGGAVEAVRTLVDEFSAMARFPTSLPQSSDINAIVQSALALFNGRLENIKVQTFLAADLPCVMADPAAMKRVIANLIDNAAEAMQESLVREVHVSTALVETGGAVEIVIADTGSGVSSEVKEKLFLPYFSTKKRGTGLGLAIAARIIEDHHGSVRVEENAPLGARFIVELPVAELPAKMNADARTAEHHA